MGEPIVPGEAERAKALQLALAILEAIRDDELPPPVVQNLRWATRDAVFSLAALVKHQHDELEQLRPVVAAAERQRDCAELVDRGDRFETPLGVHFDAWAKAVDATESAVDELRVKRSQEQ